MKKLSGLLAVSLVAVMMAPAAFADIASTEYVDKNMEAQANKKKTGEELKIDDEVGYPSVAAAFSIANIALGDQAVIKEQGTASANKALITNAKGTVETGQIKADMIADGAITADKLGANAVTTAKIATDAVTTPKIATDAVTTAKIADANVTEGKLATDSVTPLKVKDGLVTGSGSVSVERDPTTGVITVSGTDTQYNDETVKNDIKKNAADIQKNAAAIATNTANIANKQDALTEKQLKAVNSGIDETKVTTYNTAVTTANNALPKATYESQVGTVSATNMGTTATTVVGAINEIKSAVGATVKTDQGTTNKDKAVITDSNGKVTTGQIVTGMIADGTIVDADISATAAINQSKISGLKGALDGKIPVPSATNNNGTLVLTYNTETKAYAWESIGR